MSVPNWESDHPSTVGHAFNLGSLRSRRNAAQLSEHRSADDCGVVEQTSGKYDGDPKLVRDVAAVLHRRADAGVRLWPSVDEVAPLQGEFRTLIMNEVHRVTLAMRIGDDAPESFWWRRMERA